MERPSFFYSCNLLWTIFFFVTIRSKKCSWFLVSIHCPRFDLLYLIRCLVRLSISNMLSTFCSQNTPYCFDQVVWKRCILKIVGDLTWKVLYKHMEDDWWLPFFVPWIRIDRRRRTSNTDPIEYQQATKTATQENNESATSCSVGVDRCEKIAPVSICIEVRSVCIDLINGTQHPRSKKTPS